MESIRDCNKGAAITKAVEAHQEAIRAQREATRNIRSSFGRLVDSIIRDGEPVRVRDLKGFGQWTVTEAEWPGPSDPEDRSSLTATLSCLSFRTGCFDAIRLKASSQRGGCIMRPLEMFNYPLTGITRIKVDPLDVANYLKLIAHILSFS